MNKNLHISYIIIDYTFRKAEFIIYICFLTYTQKYANYLKIMIIFFLNFKFPNN